MNKKSILACCVTAIVVMALVFNGDTAKSIPDPAGQVSIGVVNVKRIFDESKKNSAFKEEMTNEQEKVLAQIEKARADIEAEQAGLKTLKPGSSEYMGQMKILMQKRANLTAEQEFQKQQLTLKERQWIEQLYSDIIRITGEVAQSRNLGIVLENSAINLEEVPDDMLVMSILMRNVMYANGAVDITDEVMNQLDAAK